MKGNDHSQQIMLLLQKNITVSLETKQRISSLNLINQKQIVIANQHSIFLYSTLSQKIQAITHTQDWGLKEDSPYRTFTIIQTHYHPYLQSIILMTYSLHSADERNKNWSLWQIKVDGQDLGEPSLLYQTTKNIAKYEGMELKPKLIILPQNQYFVFVRQFYNDSQAVVFKDKQKMQQFYLNEQCLSSFDDSHTLVSFRSLFKNKISVELFDIGQKVKSGKNGNTVCHRIEEDGVGVVVSVKQLREGDMLIVINGKEGYLKYLVYNLEKEVILGNYEKNQLKMLRFIGLYNQRVLSVQHKGLQAVLTLETPSMAIKDQINHELEYEEWTLYKQKQNFILCNYSQNIHQEQKIDISLIRIAGVEEARLALQRKFIDDDTLIEEICSLYQ